MCGFGSIIIKNKQHDFKGSTLMNMLDIIHHRGPDDEGYLLFTQNGLRRNYAGYNTNQSVRTNLKLELLSVELPLSQVNFGFKRLSILDTSFHGHQPMSYKNGRYWIIFNGEVYNYLELKQELVEFGYTFQSNSDTEVIMAAYDHYGVDCFNKFNGMWAFLILDTHRNELIVSRDRFGIKPLYYYIDNNILLFSSEIKQILTVNNVVIKPNISRIFESIKFDAREYESDTTFLNVHRFPKSCFTRIKLNDLDDLNSLTFNRYYTLTFNDTDAAFNTKKAKAFSEEYFDLLNESISLRLRADVPIGTCFSGGLDSSSVAFLMNAQLKEKNISSLQNAFSLVFTEKNTQYCDESRYIDSVASSLGIKTFKTQPTTDDVIRDYEKVVFAMDTPQSYTLMSYLYTYELVRKNNVIVTLDGQGADELQAGYLPYYRYFFMFDNIINSTHKYFSNINTMVGANKEILIGYIFSVINSIGLNRSMERYLASKELQSPFKTLNAKLFEDFNQNLETLFHFGDRGSMINSVEARFPMMDYRIVEFWMNMPANYKIYNGFTKYIARLAMNSKLPNDVTWRRDKMGWEVPHRVWILEGLGVRIKQEVLNSKFVNDLDLKFDLTLLDNIKASSRSLRELIKIYNLAIWHRVFFEEFQYKRRHY